MDIRNRLNSFINTFSRKTNNAMGDSNHFLRYGNKKVMPAEFSMVAMSDKDLYTGYSYGAITRRASGVVALAENNLITKGSQEVMDAAKKADEVLMHPYLEIIDESLDFTNEEFWSAASTFLDLEGVWYILAIRTVSDSMVGYVQSFELLNPYEIRRVRNKDTLEVGGYIETRDGMVREIPKQMIIEVRKLNPFSRDDPFSMTDAAKEAQFTLKQTGDYTRHSLKNNMAAPGIISTDVMLQPEMFKNFVSRVTNQEKGLPLFGNGAGAISWDAMQIDMDKAALDKINEIKRSELMAVSGVSKTMMSIEESGTTRETAKVQKDLFTEFQTIPQMQLIIGALNQDYKKYYPKEYEKDKYKIKIDNPLGTDRDAELKDIKIRDDSYKLYDKLVGEGYDRELASKYAEGRITLEELGEPTNDPRPNPVIEAAMLKSGQVPNPPAEDPKKQDKKEEPKPPKEDKKKEESHEHHHEHIPAIKNMFDEESRGIINQQQASLQNTIVNIEESLTAVVINKVTKVNNEFDSQNDIVTEAQRKDHEEQLEFSIAVFYGALFALYGRQTMQKRAAEFGMQGTFNLDSESKKYIKENAKRAAKSHINTITDDLLEATKSTYDRMVTIETDKLIAAGSNLGSEALYKLARKKALEGASQQQIVSAIKSEYSGHIAPNRAKAIARSETNRAFTMSQYEADRQFIIQNNLEGRAYKKWITRSANPCRICQSLAAAAPIPFKTNFADLGDELVVAYEENGKKRIQKQKVDYEALSAGNAHTNCGCIYQLVIM